MSVTETPNPVRNFLGLKATHAKWLWAAMTMVAVILSNVTLHGTPGRVATIVLAVCNAFGVRAIRNAKEAPHDGP